MTFRGAVVLALIAVSLTAGCARGVTGGTGTDGVGIAEPHPGGTGNPADALTAWQGFPVDRQPRPIVPASPLVQFAGYTTGDAKVAATLGSYRVTAALPPDPSPVPVTIPGGPATVPVIGAAAAVERMRAVGNPNAVGGETPPPPLEIVGFELGTAPILTDRGTLTLPVWRVHTADEIGPTLVLAVADSAMYRPSSVPPDSYLTDPGIRSAVLSADGRRLTLTVNEADPQCPGEAVYQSTPKLTQSLSVVVVSFAVTQTGTVPGNPEGGCPAILHLRTETYPVDLDAPLGARVVVNADAVPVPVTTG
jgi:hypothetical protein